MILNVKFEEISKDFKVKFGEVTDFNANMYQAGYDNGYSKGTTDGIESGKVIGYEQGYESGVQDGYPKGYDEGYTDGVAKTEAGFKEEKEKAYIDGWNKGNENGYSSGWDAGIEDGKQMQYDEWWNLYQPNGAEKTTYDGAFAGPRWNDNTFTPKHDLIVGSAQNMFWGSYITDLTDIRDKNGNEINIDFSPCGNWANTFAHSQTTKIRKINTNSGWAYYGGTFANASKLVTIGEFTLNGENCSFSSAFNGCSALENIKFVGTGKLATNGLNLQWSPLTTDSLKSLIACLKDYSADTSGTIWKVTVGSDNYNKLDENDKANILKKGWQFV